MNIDSVLGSHCVCEIAVLTKALLWRQDADCSTGCVGGQPDQRYADQTDMVKLGCDKAKFPCGQAESISPAAGIGSNEARPAAFSEHSLNDEVALRLSWNVYPIAPPAKHLTMLSRRKRFSLGRYNIRRSAGERIDFPKMDF